MPDNEDIIYQIKPEKTFKLNFNELWQYRELFYFFTWREVKVKYKQTLLGVLWILLQPLMQMAIFVLIAGKYVRLDDKSVSYPVFVLSGLIFWNFFASAVNNAGTSMLSNAGIIQKVFFPRIIIPTASVLSALLDFCVAFLLILVVLLISQTPVDLLAALYLWPAAFLMVLTGGLGISIWLSALLIKYRDFRFVIPFVLQLGLFVSPIWYSPADQLNPLLRNLLAVNPVYGAIALFRVPLGIDDFSVSEIYISSISAVVFLVFGFFYFRKTESFFADLA